MRRYFIVVSMLFAVSCSATPKGRANQASVERRIVFSDDVIKEFYEQHRDDLFVTARKVWVKAIVCPTLAQAHEARERAKRGEDFDELMAEYFIPHFASERKQRRISKQVDFGWVTREHFWRGDKSAGPLAGLNVGDIAEPSPRPGEGQGFAVLTIVAERAADESSLDAVSNNIYSRLCDDLADPEMLQEVNLGSKLGCGRCRAGHNLHGQMWHLAQRYSDLGEKRKAISACLFALREDRMSPGRGGPEINEHGLYPEEQFLVDSGMDVIRYYGGMIDRVIREHRCPLPDWLPSRVVRMDDERVIPLLTRLAASRGRWSQSTAYALGSIKAKSAAPTLRELLADRHIRISELSWGNKEAVYAHYYLRATARDALRRMGVEPEDVKVVVGDVKGDPLPAHHR
jgi:hypothetical protein